MGAWGVDPFESDGALDWLSMAVHDPMAQSIKQTLDRFLAQKKHARRVFILEEWARIARRRRVRRGRADRLIHGDRTPNRTLRMLGRASGHDEVEAAAALLNELTPYGKRWRIYDYTKSAEKMRKARRRRKGRRVLFYGVGFRRKGGNGWKFGVPPQAVPEGCRLIMEPGDHKSHLGLQYNAEHMGLYSLAARSVREVMDDDAYLSSWCNSSEKRAALRVLLTSLERKALTEITVAEAELVARFSFRTRRRRVSRRNLKAPKKTARLVRMRAKSAAHKPRSLADTVKRMKAGPLPKHAPKFTREELHER